jgi:MFS transporter, FHS family, L-fucose permease
MSTTKISLRYVTPVLMSFFVMSFCDLVGIGVDRVKLDFSLTNTLAQLIPSAVFLWFLLLSVPVGILQDRIGKRKVLNLGMLITALGLFVPFMYYSFTSALIAFALLGIGNTIVQVSANPLLVSVVPKARRSSFLSLSQFIKAIGSMIAPPLAGWIATQFGDWKLIFVVFGIVSLLSVLWLTLTPVKEEKSTEVRATIRSSFSLLTNRYILLMVIGIFLVVGIDVGLNAFSGQFFLSKFNSDRMFAESARSIYFFGKMLGTFGGAILLAMLPSRKFFFCSAITGLLSILLLLVVPSATLAMAVVFIIGLGLANVFPLIYSLTVEHYPQRSNEISGLMIMAVSGGAVLPPLMGVLSDTMGNVSWGMMVLLLSAAYLLFISLFNQKKHTNN